MKNQTKSIHWACLGLLTALPLYTVADEVEDRISKLEKELATLKKSVAQSDTKKSSGTDFSYGGFIKVDALWSDYDSGERALAGIGDEILVPSVIPVGDGDDGSGTRFDSHIKTSRFWFKTNTNTDAGKIRSHFEMDFLTADGDERISNSAHSRIRHAYLAWDYSDSGSLLAGQSWSTFFNVGVLPETVDFIGPTSGTIFNRQTQLRLTQKVGSGSWMFALENPSVSFDDGGSGVSGNNFDDSQVPDIVGRYNGKAGSFAYSLAAIGREVTYEDTTSGLDDSTYGFGLSFAGKLTFGKDDLKFMLSHGTLGRYIALNAFRDGAIETNGDIELNTQTGGFVAYRHWWSDKLRSSVLYAATTSDNADTVADTTNEIVSNFNINLIYSPTPKLSFGGEYINATRELESGTDGTLNRVQFMTKYVF